jgi:hypothetical protein
MAWQTWILAGAAGVKVHTFKEFLQNYAPPFYRAGK